MIKLNRVAIMSLNPKLELTVTLENTVQQKTIIVGDHLFPICATMFEMYGISYYEIY